MKKGRILLPLFIFLCFASTGFTGCKGNNEMHDSLSQPGTDVNGFGNAVDSLGASRETRDTTQMGNTVTK
jgi:hypothetical protein